MNEVWQSADAGCGILFFMMIAFLFISTIAHSLKSKPRTGIESFDPNKIMSDIQKNITSGSAGSTYSRPSDQFSRGMGAGLASSGTFQQVTKRPPINWHLVRMNLTKEQIYECFDMEALKKGVRKDELIKYVRLDRLRKYFSDPQLRDLIDLDFFEEQARQVLKQVHTYEQKAEQVISRMPGPIREKAEKAMSRFADFEDRVEKVLTETATAGTAIGTAAIATGMSTTEKPEVAKSTSRSSQIRPGLRYSSQEKEVEVEEAKVEKPTAQQVPPSMGAITGAVAGSAPFVSLKKTAKAATETVDAAKKTVNSVAESVGAAKEAILHPSRANITQAVDSVKETVKTAEESLEAFKRAQATAKEAEQELMKAKMATTRAIEDMKKSEKVVEEALKQEGKDVARMARDEIASFLKAAETQFAQLTQTEEGAIGDAVTKVESAAKAKPVQEPATGIETIRGFIGKTSQLLSTAESIMQGVNTEQIRSSVVWNKLTSPPPAMVAYLDYLEEAEMVEDEL